MKIFSLFRALFARVGARTRIVACFRAHANARIVSDDANARESWARDDDESARDPFENGYAGVRSQDSRVGVRARFKNWCVKGEGDAGEARGGEATRRDARRRDARRRDAREGMNGSNASGLTSNARECMM